MKKETRVWFFYLKQLVFFCHCNYIWCWERVLSSILFFFSLPQWLSLELLLICWSISLWHMQLWNHSNHIANHDFNNLSVLNLLSQQQLGLFICVGMFGRFPLQYWESIVYPVKNIKDVELPNVISKPVCQCPQKKFHADFFHIGNCWGWCKAEPLDWCSFFKTLQPVLLGNIWWLVIFSTFNFPRS